MIHVFDYFFNHPLIAIVDFILLLLFCILIINLIKLKQIVDKFYESVIQLHQIYNLSPPE